MYILSLFIQWFVNSCWNNSIKLSWNFWIGTVNFITGRTSDTAVVQISKRYLCITPHLREIMSWSCGNWRLNKLSICVQININVRFNLVNYCGDTEDVGLCMKKSERMKKNSSSLCCIWKLTVRQSPSRDKNECHCRSCLHKTEILFSHSNISPASWQIFFFFFPESCPSAAWTRQ